MSPGQPGLHKETLSQMKNKTNNTPSAQGQACSNDRFLFFNMHIPRLKTFIFKVFKFMCEYVGIHSECSFPQRALDALEMELQHQ